jgi:predicted MPP superfamily phosphohydrolase
MTRRQFLRLGLGLAGAYVAGRVTYCAGWEKHDLHLTRWTVPLRRLPAALSGLRVVHFSDVHILPTLPREYVRRALRIVADAGADLAVFTGDLLSAPLRYLSAYRQAFSQVHAPCGKYAVLGNHDYHGHRHERVIGFLRQTGWEVLRNESRRLPGSAEAWLVGIDDPVTDRDDFTQAMEGVPVEAFHLMLAHTPDVVVPAAQYGGDLLLAGHTHGGQVVLPFVGPPLIPSEYGARYAWGLFDYGAMRMEVTRGIGMVPPRVRFNCPPEVALLTLVRDEQFPYHNGPTKSCGPWMSRAR